MNSTIDNVSVARWIGKFEHSPSLPTLILLSGIHGNELSGVKAIEFVFKTIHDQSIPLNGNLYGIRGNLKAIEQEKRFIDIDLNRAWTDKKIEELTSVSKISESEEVIAIKKILDDMIDQAKAPLYFVDLHTTSSASPPFVILDDTIRNRKFASILPATKVLGILEKLKGTILGYYGDKGPVTLVFEAGQHLEKSSFDRHVAAIWLLMVQSGVIEASSIDVKKHIQVLESSSQASPSVVQTTYRHILEIHDVFEMKPGYENFSKVKKGEVIAYQNSQPVIVKDNANIFMPLYQKQGEDGYFIVKPISSFWVNLSKTLRKLKVERLFSILPGIQKNPNQKDSFIINRKVASFKTIALIHLFGFRREKERGKFTYVSKRPYDFKGPWD